MAPARSSGHDASVTSSQFRVAFLGLFLLVACDPGEVIGPGDDTGPTPEVDAGPPDLVTHDVRIIVEPSDDGAMLNAAIDAATTSVHMTMYLLTDQDVIDALVRAHGRGLDVRVILQRSFPTGGTTNDDAFMELATAGIGVHWAPSRFALTHEKCVVIDGDEAWIMTMNLATTSASTNREYLAVDHEPVDVHDADAIFEADYADVDYPSYAGPLLLAPVNAQGRLLDLIRNARHSIDVEDEELSDTGIVNALVGAVGRGVTVRVLIDAGSLTSAQQGAVTNLMNAGIPVRSLGTPDIHAKAMVVDNAIAYVGSINFTTASITHNRELGIVTDDGAAVTTIATTIAADFNAGRSF
jgi:phosphatidylserine/phosphatidylglycerophosphate/cardiolipin synthase-like enzyme